ncbi:hypothetical protein [Paenibacillus segetis]|uniref:FAD/FMN-containing dehydrogenase n=1 Tax=Paenibacillus segetis TaxID=1325360 RepID=A0ABQ1YDS4_9BACL|nr:hypothetical protein [Paenibacillus segetis]GGH21689.1 hypothetical protein GCM10008013_19730 [Paenibacillus segetis]
MKKKLIVSLSVIALTMSIGTAVIAAGNNEGNYNNYEDMLPHMQQVHPDLNEKQLNDMYNNCHNNTDVKKQNSNAQNMMHSRGMM